MFPIILDLGIFTIHTYGLLIAIGFFIGIQLAKIEAKRVGIDPEEIMDMSFYLLLAAIIGSRLFYVIVEIDKFIEDPIEIFKIWKGGLVFFGGFLGAVAVITFYIKRHHLPFWKTADVLAPSISIGQFFGRLGCFSAGCCYGKVCSLPWQVTYSDPVSLAPTGIGLHPTQLYSAFSNLCIFIILFLMQKKKKFEGQVFWSYALFYGITRSIVEIFRGDDRGLTVFNLLSISQTIGVAMAVISIFMLMKLKNKPLQTQ